MVSTLIFPFLFVVLSLTVNVNSQTCDNAIQYSACSLNSNCGCFSYSFSNSMGICGLRNQSCSDFIACQSPNDACPQPGYICVSHPQCGSSSVCYPLSLTGRAVCPITIVTNYSNALTVSSQNFTRGNVGQFYYYQAIEVRVATTGSYTFKTSSTIADTYGYLYQGNFYPSYITYNKIAADDDGSGAGQFRITATLRSDITYILVFTTYTQRATGSFNISASGPDDVYMNPINIQ